MLDRHGLPRRELGLAFVGAILLLALGVLILDPADHAYGAGALLAVFIAGATAGAMLIWIDKRTTKELFPSSLEERIARHEKNRRLQAKSFVPVAVVATTFALIPDRYESLVLAFAVGAMVDFLAWFIIDRWIVLPRQLSES